MATHFFVSSHLNFFILKHKYFFLSRKEFVEDLHAFIHQQKEIEGIQVLEGIFDLLVS